MVYIYIYVELGNYELTLLLLFCFHNQLKKLTRPELKVYLRHHNMALSGNKVLFVSLVPCGVINT
jgi:hypothetical protein